ncbi:hypothetical protein [Bradyrhizobium diazoefficiens]|uniref:hypothetical protein n=1 Tax=Bradyrhizobium diazoefficiens TaxID=1355477 RepID=UPI003832C107
MSLKLQTLERHHIGIRELEPFAVRGLVRLSVVHQHGRAGTPWVARSTPFADYFDAKDSNLSTKADQDLGRQCRNPRRTEPAGKTENWVKDWTQGKSARIQLGNRRKIRVCSVLHKGATQTFTEPAN